ncbi:WXG100 family type VII secretion target [Brevibacillus fulvus]|uniref:Uncharacterized protein YukE n=1 Tax=Brevibacillus fulvus TaxID=1125967 RepID=A0A938XSU9_9BACL|nr:type VII secretion target [Brevibacillus fulvus]MBM7589793.1 uncharacterized protein YukE [Brevibacillus fulvus]
MTRILVTPELLHNLSKDFEQAAHQLNQVRDRLHGTMSSLSWEVRQKLSIEEKWNAAQSAASSISTQNQAFSRRLTQSAELFQTRDQEGAKLLGSAVAASLLRSMGATPLGSAALLAAGSVALTQLPQEKWKEKLAELGRAALTPAAKIALFRTMLTFTPGKTPGVYNVSTKVAGTKLASLYYRYVGTMANRYLPAGIAKKVPNTLSGVVKQVVGLKETFNRASSAGISNHLLKNAVKKFPVVGALIEGFGAVKSIGTAVETHQGETREEYWRNVARDSASSLNRAFWRTLGGWAGGAAAVAVTWETGPGAVAAAIGGSYVGTQLGDQIADWTDNFARKGGELVGNLIPDAIDKTKELAANVGNTFKEAGDAIKDGVQEMGKKIDQGLKSLIKLPEFFG